MVETGDLIGIVHNRPVYVVSTEDNHYVTMVQEYRPVSREEYEFLNCPEHMMRSIYDGGMRDSWKRSVRDNKTELGFDDYVKWKFAHEWENADPGNKWWFYGQEITGPGRELVYDMDVHSRVARVVEDLLGWDIRSFEDYSIPWSFKQFPLAKKIEWQHIFNEEAAQGLEDYRLKCRWEFTPDQVTATTTNYN